MENIKCYFSEPASDPLDAAEGVMELSVVVKRKSNFEKFSDKISKYLNLEEVKYHSNGSTVRLIFKVDWEEPIEPIIESINEVYESLFGSSMS